MTVNALSLSDVFFGGILNQAFVHGCFTEELHRKNTKGKKYHCISLVYPCEHTMMFLHAQETVTVTSKGFLKLGHIWHRWLGKLGHLGIFQRAAVTV